MWLLTNERLTGVDNEEPKLIFCNEPAVQFHSLVVKKRKSVCPRRGRVHKSLLGGSYRLTNVSTGVCSRLDGRGIPRAIGFAQDVKVENHGPPHHRVRVCHGRTAGL
jgi:hypothetical protein